MRSLGLFLILLIQLCSCAPVKPLPVSLSSCPEGNPEAALCSPLHPGGDWQFTHTITFRTAGGASSSLLGVTVIRGTRLDCALITREGLTLFAAHQTDHLEVERAVPPFDRPGFARELMADVRALFFPPPGRVVGCGVTGEGMDFCRLQTDEGLRTELAAGPGFCRRMTTWDRNGNLSRTIAVETCRVENGVTIPEQLSVDVPGPAGYTLQLQLIEAIPIFR